MKLAITGAGGFVGSALSQRLTAEGHSIVALHRADLDPCRPALELAHRLEGVDGVIHLAGATISRRWTRAWRDEIRRSRVDVTRRLVTAMPMMDTPPPMLLSASAIGAFSDRQRADESTPPDATDFLGQLSRDWEAEALRARESGVRTVIMRFGLVLGRDGGLLGELLPVFRLGLGGPVGSGRQMMSWIHLDDLTRAVNWLIDRQDDGVFHLCAPRPVTNRAFASALGAALGRPAVIPVPRLALWLRFGAGADVMTSGQEVVSRRLPEAGFRFRWPEIGEALADLAGGAPARDSAPAARGS